MIVEKPTFKLGIIQTNNSIKRVCTLDAIIGQN